MRTLLFLRQYEKKELTATRSESQLESKVKHTIPDSPAEHHQQECSMCCVGVPPELRHGECRSCQCYVQAHVRERLQTSTSQLRELLSWVHQSIHRSDERMEQQLSTSDILHLRAFHQKSLGRLSVLLSKWRRLWEEAHNCANGIALAKA